MHEENVKLSFQTVSVQLRGVIKEKSVRKAPPLAVQHTSVENKEELPSMQ